MSFIWPVMLASLLLLPLFVLLYVRQGRRRRQLSARSGGFGQVRAGGGSGPGARRHIAPALFLLALAVLLVALARPQAAVSLPRLEGTVILVFDVSGSMAAADIEPTRMEAAKTLAENLVQRQPATVRMGVVAFSDGGLAVQVPTNEKETILAAIKRLTPQRGTSVGQGIMAALNAIAIEAGATPEFGAPGDPAQAPTPAPEAPSTPAVIVLLSDGENNAAPDPLEVAQAAAERDVRIYTVGVGTRAGATLELDGFSVHTQLEEENLQQIAKLTGGAYYSAEDEQGLQAIYDDVATRLVIRPDQTEVTALLVGVGFLFLLIGGLCSLLWFGRLP